MWTIFESLAGDLCKAAHNRMPDGLLELQDKKRYKRRAFTGLRGIKEAFEAAFYKNSSIDPIIQSDVFERVSALRNLIVHRSGTADDEYIQRTQETAGLPDLPRGEKLRLDGTMIEELLSGATNQARALILAVDQWLDDHAISPD
jgi:hypothetical protein